MTVRSFDLRLGSTLFPFCVLRMLEPTCTCYIRVVTGVLRICGSRHLTVIGGQPYVADRHQLHDAFTAFRLCFRPLTLGGTLTFPATHDWVQYEAPTSPPAYSTRISCWCSSAVSTCQGHGRDLLACTCPAPRNFVCIAPSAG